MKLFPERSVKRPRLVKLFIAASLLLSAATAQEIRPADGLYRGTSSVKFAGNSNLHPFGGTIEKVPLMVSFKDGKMNAKIGVTVTDMTTEKRLRDRAMWKMFSSDRFPVFQVTVSDAPYAAAYPGNGQPGKLPITITIAGKSSQTVAETSNFKFGKNSGSFRMQMSLSLKKLGLTAPVAMAGALRVDDQVEVSCEVILSN